MFFARLQAEWFSNVRSDILAGKIRIVLEGLRGEESIAALCRREAIGGSLYYAWSKEFRKGDKRRLAGDTARAVTSDEVKTLRQEARALKEVVQGLAYGGINPEIIKHLEELGEQIDGRNMILRRVRQDNPQYRKSIHEILNGVE